MWDADTRGTQTGGSFHRNSSSNTTSVPSSGCKTYIPRHYGFNWRYLSWGVRVSIPGGSGNSNSMDNFSAGTNDINRIYVDGLSITHGANATNGAGSGRSHIYTIHVDGNNTGGNNGGSTPGFTSNGNGRVNLQSHNGSTTSAYAEYKAVYDKGSSSDTRIEMRMQSDQDTGNEDIYCRAWYMLIK